MGEAGFPIHGISDLSVFGAHDWAADRLVEISECDCAPPAMQALRARHHVWFHPTALARKSGEISTQTAARVYGTLRIDAENRMLSGDLFRDIRRRDWICSWVSEAIFAAPDPRPEDWGDAGWDLLSIADIHWPGKMIQRTGRFAKLVVALSTKGENIRGCRLIGIDGAERHVADLTLTDPERHCYDSFRRMTLVNIFHGQTKADMAYVHLAIRALGHRQGEKLRQDLQATGAGVYWDEPPPITPALGTAQHEKDFGVFPIQDATQREDELLSGAQWSGDPYRYTTLLTTLVHKKGVSGVVPGLDGARPAQKPRNGAIVYIKQIVDNQLARHDLTAKTYFDERGQPRDTFAKLTATIEQRIRLFYMHELGHMMNLPHPWQRDVFSTPELPAQPAARSLMNYGSLYPLGRLMEISRRRKTSDEDELTRLLRADSDRSFAGPLKNTIYTKVEVQWIRHAPFDFFVPGDNVFTQDLREDPRLAPPTSDKRPLLLDIWDAETDPDGTHVLSRRRSEDRTRQPVFGRVTFRVLPQFIGENYVPFTFQSPALTLAVRGEYDSRSDPDVIKFVQAVPLPFEADNGLTGPDFAAATREVTIRGRVYQEFSCAIPLLQHPFFESFTQNNPGFRPPDAFTLQVILRTSPRVEGGYPQTFRSNKLRITFKRPAVRGGQSAAPHPRILDHPEMPLLAEALGTFANGGDIAGLRRHHPHNYEAVVTPIKTLVADIKSLPLQEASTATPRFLRYLQNRLGDTEQTRALLAKSDAPDDATIAWARSLDADRLHAIRSSFGRNHAVLAIFDAFMKTHKT